MEKQSKMPEYTDDVSILAMNTKVTQLGFVMLFGSVAPGASFVILIFFAATLRIDAFKFCQVYKRALAGPKPVTGIGEWNQVVQLLVAACRFTAFGIPVLNSEFLDNFLVIWQKLVL